MGDGRDTKERLALEADTQRDLSPVTTKNLGFIPALTILLHEEMSRMGETCQLAQLTRGERVALSRQEPGFHPVGQSDARPLLSRYLSRQPVWLEQDEDGRIDIIASVPRVELRVQGYPTPERTSVSWEDVQNGVLIQLADRLIVLLHAVPSVAPLGRTLGLVGQHSSIERVRNDILSVSDLDVPVLIRGETGAGKELVASAIHRNSRRKDAPYVSINMAAINPATAVSDLFGHVRGAFTGASRDHAGYFGNADGGTIFMDEVGDTPPEIQVMLLRVLETGEIQPVGARKARHVDVRIVSATDSNLEEAVQAGTFRAPLLHRLDGYSLGVPPLRERREDIPRLVLHFLRTELEQTGEVDRLDSSVDAKRLWFPPSLMAKFMSYDWPGNVRQLRNVLRQLVVSSRGSNSLRVSTIADQLEPVVGQSSDKTVPPLAGRPSKANKRPSELSTEEIVAVLIQHNWELTPAAKTLGIARASLYTIIQQHRGIRTAGDLSAEEIAEAMARHDDDVTRVASELRVSKRALKMRIKALNK